MSFANWEDGVRLLSPADGRSMGKTRSTSGASTYPWGTLIGKVFNKLKHVWIDQDCLSFACEVRPDPAMPACGDVTVASLGHMFRGQTLLHASPRPQNVLHAALSKPC